MYGVESYMNYVLVKHSTEDGATVFCIHQGDPDTGEVEMHPVFAAYSLEDLTEGLHALVAFCNSPDTEIYDAIHIFGTDEPLDVYSDKVTDYLQ